ncbi:MAG: SDR family NAD(P)-dependent oxidoreductase [Alphaproteobacteria bacterium]|nr:SDR family NAD(P)-dependent oxidoreductase [Alphaproteobacteria bacterium]
MTVRRKVAWVTGASQGIGAAVARRLARDGWVVAASARSTDKLEALAAESDAWQGSVEAFPLDVTDEAAVTVVYEEIEARLGAVDLVILNAGTHQPIAAADFAVAPVRKLIEINLMGTVHCLAPVISRFVERQSGRIAVVASLAGYRGLPTASAYGASKAGLINMCESLRPELQEQGVVLSCVTPGFVRTPLTDRNPFPMPFLIDANTAAARIVSGLAGNRFEITFPRRFAYLMKLLRVLPYALYFPVVRRVSPRRD